jgi:hypothetical protein
MRIWIALLAMLLSGYGTVSAFAVEPLEFTVRTDVPLRELSADFCWFHPRVAAIPGAGQNDAPAVILTLQKHLLASDHYSGLYFMRSDDLGATWTQPVLPPELDWQKESEEVDIAVCDVTPGWHPQSKKLLAIGTKLRYSRTGEQLTEVPGGYQGAYAVYDPANNAWTTWKLLETPDLEGRFFQLAPGCVQWLVRDDGDLLVPCYFKGPTGSDYSSTVLHCRFDGETLSLVETGDEFAMAGGRGLVEPSLARYDGRYYLTLRNDNGGYVTTSDDGLHFEPLTPWKFDDGTDLGSYNTQQHWLVHSDGLFLSYTRRGANNDHIFRHRAPLFIAQVDPTKLKVLRDTEQVAIPDRGAPLGNFGAAAITADESWITDAEYILSDTPDARGADGSVFISRIRWGRPNRSIQAK